MINKYNYFALFSHLAGSQTLCDDFLQVCAPKVADQVRLSLFLN